MEIEAAEREYQNLLTKSESSDIDSDLNNRVELEENSSMQVISNEISELRVLLEKSVIQTTQDDAAAAVGSVSKEFIESEKR